MPGALGGQNTTSDPLELEFQMACEPPCGCWNWNQVLWKHSQCSKALGHCSSPGPQLLEERVLKKIEVERGVLIFPNRALKQISNDCLWEPKGTVTSEQEALRKPCHECHFACLTPLRQWLSSLVPWMIIPGHQTLQGLGFHWCTDVYPKSTNVYDAPEFIPAEAGRQLADLECSLELTWKLVGVLPNKPRMSNGFSNDQNSWTTFL